MDQEKVANKDSLYSTSLSNAWARFVLILGKVVVKFNRKGTGKWEGGVSIVSVANFVRRQHSIDRVTVLLQLLPDETVTAQSWYQWKITYNSNKITGLNARLAELYTGVVSSEINRIDQEISSPCRPVANMELDCFGHLSVRLHFRSNSSCKFARKASVKGMGSFYSLPCKDSTESTKICWLWIQRDIFKYEIMSINVVSRFIFM